MPLMLMHGGMGFDHTYFRPWLDPLAKKFQLIFYDHRGNGRSAPLDDFAGVDQGAWADDADALRRHLGHEKIILLGHSAGAFAAQEYALRYGDHLAGLVLCSAAPVIDYPNVIMANAQARTTPEQLRTVGKLFSSPFISNDEMRADIEMLLPLYFKNYDPEIGWRMAKDMQFSCDAFNHFSAVCVPAMNFLPRLHEISVPTLVISGRHDWIMPLAEGGERLHAGIAKSELAIFEQSGHFPFIEEWELFIKTISEWADRMK